MKDLKAIAQGVLPALKQAAEDYSRLRGFSFATVAGAVRVTRLAVKQVEAAGVNHELGAGEKKELALLLLESLAPAPWWLPKAWYRELLGRVVDAVVEALDDKF